jgi:hypothetical protein
MLTMRDHGVGDYAELRDMNESDVGELTEDDKKCLDELAEYLAAADTSQRFALWLLHKHFLPEPGEVFVERVITSPPQVHTSPVDRAAFSPTGLQAIAVRFDTEVASGVGLVGMEFTESADLEPIAPIGPGDEAVLAGLAERLRSHGKIDRFGVRLVRDPLELSDDQVLFETWDRTRRALDCSVVNDADVPTDQSAASTWRVKTATDENGRAAATKWCTAIHCYHS